jgi:hypothetical protein
VAVTGWLVAALLLALGIACGLGWLAARERRLRHQAEADAYSERARADARTRSLEQRDAELAAAHTARILAQRAAREATERLRVAALPDADLPGELAAALADRRDAARADTADELGGRAGGGSAGALAGLRSLAAREAGLPAGTALPSGVGGPGGVGRALAR